MHLINVALRLLRLAGEALFMFEVNRILGRCVSGTINHRRTRLTHAESALTRAINSPHIIKTITLPSGLHLHTLIAGEHAPGNNPLVLLHGHSMAAAFFAHNVDALLDAGYSSVLAPDLPGWGRSSRPQFQRGEGPSQAVEFFIKPLGEWVRVMGLKKFTLLGHSLGGYIAYDYAMRHEMQVVRLVLMAPAAVTRSQSVTTAAWFAFTPQRFLMHGGLIARILFALKYPREMRYRADGMREYLFGANSTACNSGDTAAAAMLKFWREGREWRAECVRPLLERVKRVGFQVDLISGDRDCLVHVESVRTLYRRLLAEGNSVRINIIPGADHSPHICTPGKFVKAIMRGMCHTAADITTLAQPVMA